MSFDDELRAHQEHLRLGMTRAGRKYLDSSKLTEEVPEPYTAAWDAQLTHDDLLGAQRELAEKHGVSTARVRGMVMLATVQAGLGYSEQEQTAVLMEVMLSLESGQASVSDAQILELSGRGGDDLAGLASALTDVAHLDAAAVLCRSGHGDWKDAGPLIARRAGQLGIPDPLGKGAVAATPGTMQLALSMAGAAGCGDAEVTLAGQTQETRALLLAGAGQDSAAKAIGRHPELAYMFRPPRTSSRKHPAQSGRAGMLTTETRAHSGDLDEDPRDSRQPARGGEVHRGVREILRDDLAGVFAPDSGREGEGTGNVTWPAKSAVQREAEQRRSLAGGRPGGRSIPGLHPRTLPGSSGSVRA